MTQNKENKIDQLISLIEGFNVQELDAYLRTYLSRKADANLALVELDSLLAILQGKILSISIRIKQNLLQRQNAVQPVDGTLYSRKEIAKRFRVNVRTVDNWIKDGLETVPIGGTVRLSLQAVEEYSNAHRSKKMHWKIAA
jgi:hypothetical protein